MTHRIKVNAELHTTNVFYGNISDEKTGKELVTRTLVEKITYQRYRVTPTCFGNGIVAQPVDVVPVEIPAEEYELFDSLQTGLPYSSEGNSYTFLWRVGVVREPFFPESGSYFVVVRFHPREGGEIETLTYEAKVA